MSVYPCPACSRNVSTEANFCTACGHPIAAMALARPTQSFWENRLDALRYGTGVPALPGSAPARSDALAGCLGFLLGPVGLWYKGNWAAGFAWLVMGAIVIAATGMVAAPFVWVGMGLHAMVARPK